MVLVVDGTEYPVAAGPARCEDAEVVELEEFGGDAGRGLQGASGGDAGGDHGGELLPVLSVREHAGVGPEGDLDVGVRDMVRAVQQSLLVNLVLAALEGRLACPEGVVIDVAGVVEGGELSRHQVDTLVDHDLQCVGGGEVAVLDAAHPGVHRPAHPFVAVAVGGGVAAQIAGGGDQGVHLFLAVGRLGRIVRGTGEPAGGTELDPVGAGADLGAHPAADLVAAVGSGQFHRSRPALVLVVQCPGEVAVCAPRGDQVRGHQHARSLDQSCGDRVAQIEGVVPGVGGHQVPDGGEPVEQHRLEHRNGRQCGRRG
ncbi:hypothetical protein STENM327S_07758 [Streptomyces tendae]